MYFKNYLAYLNILIVITFIAISYQLMQAPLPQNIHAWVYLLSVYGYFGFIIVAIGLFFYPLQRFILPIRWLLPLIATLWMVYWIADIMIFRMYGFHLDGLLMKMFILDFRGMGLPTLVIGLIIAAIVLILGLNIYLYRYFLHHLVQRCSWFAVGFVVLVLLFAANTSLSIWSAYYSRGGGELLAYNRFLPLYYPVTSHKLAPRLSAALPNWFPPQQGKGGDLEKDINRGSIHYPKHALQCNPILPKANILIIGLESWQATSLNDAVMPKLSQLIRQRGTFYKNHLSGGTATIPGLFSLFTGLEASYYKPFRSDLNGGASVLIKTLRKYGYAIHEFSASDFDRFNLRDLILPDVVAPDYHQTHDDAQTFAAIQRAMQKDKSHQPYLDFIFLLSSHSPYVYPPSGYDKFKPLPTVEGGYLLDRYTDSTPYKNDYYNSLFYLDDMINNILQTYRDAGKLNNTWIIITGDHAEEFNENGKGYWGHGSNFTRWQNAVPMIIIRPQDKQERIVKDRTYHMDIVPTLMRDVLGCTNPVSDYSNGMNVRDVPPTRNSIISSYYTNAYLIGNKVYEGNTGKAYTWDGMQPLPENTPDTKAFQALLRSQKRFLSP